MLGFESFFISVVILGFSIKTPFFLCASVNLVKTSSSLWIPIKCAYGLEKEISCLEPLLNVFMLLWVLNISSLQSILKLLGIFFACIVKVGRGWFEHRVCVEFFLAGISIQGSFNLSSINVFYFFEQVLGMMFSSYLWGVRRLGIVFVNQVNIDPIQPSFSFGINTEFMPSSTIPIEWLLLI